MFCFLFLEKIHIILVVSNDCHQFPIFASYIGNNTYQRKYFNDIFIVPLLHNLPNAYFRLIPYPVVMLTFLILRKILVEIFHKFVKFHSGMQTSITITIFLILAQVLMFFVFFYTEAAVKICPN